MGEQASSFPQGTFKSATKRTNDELKDEDGEDDEEPVRKRSRKPAPKEQKKAAAKKTSSEQPKEPSKAKTSVAKPREIKSEPSERPLRTEKKSKAVKGRDMSDLNEAKNMPKELDSKSLHEVEKSEDEARFEEEDEEAESDEDENPEVAAKAREKMQSKLKSSATDPYPDWKPGEPVPYAALCTTFSLIEMTTKRLIISAHCSLFLRQVLRLTPQDLLPTVQLMINKLAADYAGIELGIGESLIMKAIGESTGRSLQIIKADQAEIGDLGLVAAKSRSNQPTMFKPKALTVKGVLDGLMGIATISGDGSQGRKIAGIKKLLSAADAAIAGKGNKSIDITKDKGGPSEAKFIIRFLEGKLRLGLAEKTVLVALAHAMVFHEMEQQGKKVPSSEKLAEGEAVLKTVFR